MEQPFFDLFISTSWLGAGIYRGLTASALAFAFDIPQVKHTEKEWREILGDVGYNVMREEGTERPFSRYATRDSCGASINLIKRF